MRQRKEQEQEADAGLSSADELTDVARQYFSSEFSNPSREGCPAPEESTKAAAAQSLPSDDLRAHLFSCSECFTEFRETLAASASALSRRQHSWWGLITANARPAFAAAAALVLLAAAVVFMFVLRDRPDTVSPITSNGKASQQPSANVADSNKAAEPRSTSESPGKPSSPSLAAARLTIDLEDYPLLREGVGEDLANKPIQLSRSLTEMVLRLPEGGRRGRYTIRISNTKLDRTYVSSQARSSKGKELRTTLNLSKLKPGRYVLCISPAGHVPFCYEVRVGARK